MKQFLLSALIITAMCSGCLRHNHYGCGFINDPDFNKFGASFSREAGVYIIKSYIQSGMILRSEYIYENFDITIPDSFVPGKEYSIAEPGVKFWYAKGGQAGQIETAKAKGTFTIKNITGEGIELELNIKFYDFKKTEFYSNLPEYILRKGTLGARKGYKLY